MNRKLILFICLCLCFIASFSDARIGIMATGGHTATESGGSPTVVWEATEQTGDSTWANGSGDGNHRMVIQSAYTSGSGTQIRVTLKAGTGGDLIVVGVGIGPQSSNEDATAMTRITFDTGNSGCTVPSSGTKVSDLVNFSWNDSTTYLVAIYVGDIGSNTMSYLQAGSGTHKYYSASLVDESQTASVSGYSGNAYVHSLLQIEAQ